MKISGKIWDVSPQRDLNNNLYVLITIKADCNTFQVGKKVEIHSPPTKDQTEKKCDNPRCRNGVLKTLVYSGGVHATESKPCPDCQKDQSIAESPLDKLDYSKLKDWKANQLKPKGGE